VRRVCSRANSSRVQKQLVRSRAYLPRHVTRSMRSSPSQLVGVRGRAGGDVEALHVFGAMYRCARNASGPAAAGSRGRGVRHDSGVRSPVHARWSIEQAFARGLRGSGDVRLPTTGDFALNGVALVQKLGGPFQIVRARRKRHFTLSRFVHILSTWRGLRALILKQSSRGPERWSSYAER